MQVRARVGEGASPAEGELFAQRLDPVQGFPGSDSVEAQTAAEQLAQARGLVPSGAYQQAFTAMKALPVTGSAWTESTPLPVR